MADVRPFRGWRYHPDGAGPLGALLCPPYDVISPDIAAALRARSPYNSIHLEVAPPSDHTPRSAPLPAAALNAWQEQGVVRQDPAPALYLYEHRFPAPGRSGCRASTRRGVLAAVRLHAWDERIILPHERTASGPTTERLQLLHAAHANVSPLFALYADADGGVAAVLRAAWLRPPEVVAEVAGEAHSLRVVRDAAIHRAVAVALAGRQLYIADGHHRYEVALAYRDERRRAERRQGGSDAGAEFTLMCLVDLADPGVGILPMHRLVHDLTPAQRDSLTEALRRAGTVTPLHSAATSPAALATAAQAALTATPRDRPVFVLVTREGIWRVQPGEAGPAGRELDVAVADAAIQVQVGGRTAGMVGRSGRVTFAPEAAVAAAAVQQGSADLAVLLRPVTAERVVALAQAGIRMPPKSTYFHPKPATGLVFHSLAGERPLP